LKEKEQTLFGLLAKLDWVKILRGAIESRSSSWAFHPVVEWRNASDCVFSALMSELRYNKIDPFESKVKIKRGGEVHE